MSGSLKTEENVYTLRYDEGATYTYIGQATVGTPTGGGFWRIKRLTNADNTILWAEGDAEFNKMWDTRTSYIYL